MDNEASLPKLIKRRRRHSPAFKQRVVAECRQPNTSIAEVAMRHGLNLNLVHTWRRTVDAGSSGEFVRLPQPATQPDASQSVTREPPAVSIRLAAPQGTITVEWPLREIDRSVAWLRALMQ
jgi:transposase-like protein